MTIVASPPLRPRDVRALIKRRDVCAVVESPPLADLRPGEIDLERSHFILTAWFTGALNWVVYYRD